MIEQAVRVACQMGKSFKTAKELRFISATFEFIAEPPYMLLVGEFTSQICNSLMTLERLRFFPQEKEVAS